MSRRAEISTAELSDRTGVPVHTIRRMHDVLDAVPVGGNRGYLFPASAEVRLFTELRRRHERGHSGRKPGAKNRGGK